MGHDLAFHVAIAQTARNRPLAMIVGAFQGVARQSWPVGWRSRAKHETRLANIQTHIDMADAIAVGDAQPDEMLMRRHFDDSTKVLLDAGLT